MKKYYKLEELRRASTHVPNRGLNKILNHILKTKKYLFENFKVARKFNFVKPMSIEEKEAASISKTLLNNLLK